MADKGILAINDILNEYSNDIQEGITKEAEEIAKKGAKELKDTKGTYKIRTGKYNKGWRVDTTKGYGFVNCIVHNKTNYQLTHLLEKGHRIVGRDGQLKGYAKKYVHIKPVEERITREYEKKVENIIKNGG